MTTKKYYDPTIGGFLSSEINKIPEYAIPLTDDQYIKLHSEMCSGMIFDGIDDEGNIKVKAKVLSFEHTIRYIRKTRDSLLKKSDWVLGPDSPVTKEKQAEWVTYRQHLRDVTENLTEQNQTVVWPIKPGR